MLDIKMSKAQLETKGPSPTDLIEEESKQILRAKLPLNEAIFVWYPDKHPNLDGHIEFINKSGSTTVKLFFQLKGSNQNVGFYDCDRSFLNYCYLTPEPTFLIFVNIPLKKVYWEHITPAYIISVLGIQDLQNFEQDTKRITFSEENTIEQNAQDLRQVCEKHYKDLSMIRQYIQESEAKLEFVSGQEPLAAIINETIHSKQQQATDVLAQITVIKPQEEAHTFDSLREKFSGLFNNFTDNLMLYYSFIYVLRPFYLDHRGENKRRKLLELLNITDAEERFMIESLVNKDLLERVGNLISVTEKEAALLSFNHYLDEGRLDLEEITQLFSDDEDQS